MRPTAGRVLYDGQEVTGPNRRVGYMTQKDTLLPWRTTSDNIRIALELKSHAVPRAEADDRVRQIIEQVGLKGFENHTPAELSGGMRKRAAMARTLIYEPETLLMDEPFGALDSQLKLLMLDQLQSLTQHRHMSVVFVTHDLGEAITLSDRIVVMSARPGRIRAIHEVKLERPRDVFKVRFTPAFPSSMNGCGTNSRTTSSREPTSDGAEPDQRRDRDRPRAGRNGTARRSIARSRGFSQRSPDASDRARRWSGSSC